MPLDYKKYPQNWYELQLAVLKRAQYHCEGSPAYPKCRAKQGMPHPVTDSLVLLSVAHFDRDLGNNELTNLRAWCQRCHLRHDISQHIESRKYGRDFRKRQLTFSFYNDYFLNVDAWLLRQYLGIYHDDKLECDTQTSVFTYLLKHHKIPHRVMCGTLTVDRLSIPLHYWIEANDIIIDYQARKSIRDNDLVPHGCFYRREYPYGLYRGKHISMPVSKEEFNSLTNELQLRLELFPNYK